MQDLDLLQQEIATSVRKHLLDAINKSHNTLKGCYTRLLGNEHNEDVLCVHTTSGEKYIVWESQYNDTLSDISDWLDVRCTHIILNDETYYGFGIGYINDYIQKIN